MFEGRTIVSQLYELFETDDRFSEGKPTSDILMWTMIVASISVLNSFYCPVRLFFGHHA